MADKNGIRREALARRDGLALEARIEKSLAMARHGEAIALDPGAIVAGYLPIRSEPDLRPLMARLAERGARLCLPVVLDRETIVFRAFVRGAPLVSTGFGTSGPSDGAAVLEPDVLFVPLSAFDAAGHRLGYGAGHYDRAISRLHAIGRRPLLIGTGFDLQETAALPAEPHDVALDMMLTESGLRRFARSL